MTGVKNNKTKAILQQSQDILFIKKS